MAGLPYRVLLEWTLSALTILLLYAAPRLWRELWRKLDCAPVIWREVCERRLEFSNMGEMDAAVEGAAARRGEPKVVKLGLNSSVRMKPTHETDNTSHGCDNSATVRDHIPNAKQVETL